VAYTLFGGFLAVSLTDFVQGCIMFIALIVVPAVAYAVLGGAGAVAADVRTVDPALLTWFEGVTVLGLISSLSWGLGYFGQPHIIVRFMAIRSVEDMPVARRIGMTWMIVTLIGAVATGIVGLAYITGTGAVLDDAETIFIRLSQVLFHPVIGGFLLAAILAAIMSTISSQLLVSSSSLTEDFYKTFVRRSATQSELVLAGRASVLAVAVVAALLALDSTSTILGLVANAWAGFGAAFGPVILLSLFWRRLNRTGALAGMIAGAVTVLIWIYAPIGPGGTALSGVVYEIVPGFAAALVAAVAVSLASAAPSAAIAGRNDAVTGTLSGGTASPPR